MAEWLTAAQAAALVDSSAAVDGAAWAGAVDAAVAYVQERRSDLYSADAVPVFVASAAVRLGTAMLANRWYTRRVSPLGTSQNVEFGGSDFLRQDPDIAKLLGLGTEGPVVFGGARARELDALIVVEGT